MQTNHQPNKKTKYKTNWINVKHVLCAIETLWDNGIRMLLRERHIMNVQFLWAETYVKHFVIVFIKR